MIANYWRGSALALTTAVLWGISAPMTKIISAGGLSPLSVMVYRCVFISLILGGWLRVKRGAEVLRPSVRMLRVYTALGFMTIVCMASGYMVSCVYLTVPQAVILHYAFPLLTIFGDFTLTGERPRLIQLASALMILAGIYIGFDVGGTGFADVSAIGLVWGTISVFGFAGQTLLARVVSRDGASDPLTQVFFVHLLGGIMLALGKSAFMGWGDAAFITPRVFLLMHYPAVGSGLLGFICLFASLRFISATTASLICALEIVFTLSLSPFLIGGAASPQEMAGSAVIMAAVACSTLGKRIPAKKT